MDPCDTAKPIPVKCDYCFKDYSSSTIVFHQKKHHSDLPYCYTPSEINCNKCMKIVAVSNLHAHYVMCEKRTKKKSLRTIFEDLADDFRITCRYCKRKFLLERIEKHESACEVSSKKRPLFDMLRKRVPNLRETYKKIISKRGSLNLIYPNSKWQKQHLEVLRNLRCADDENSYEDYIACPYCSRRFAPNNAEKHIDICKNILNKPKAMGIALNRFPSIKKIESLSFRTNSTHTLWRPECEKNNNDISSFADESDNKENKTCEIGLQLGKSPILEKELAESSEKKEYPTVNCRICGIKMLESVAENHLLSCNKKTLMPSATVQSLEKKQRLIKLKKRTISNERKFEKNRSHSTKRLSDVNFCPCGVAFPKQAKFCMMCGNVRNNYYI